MNDNDIPNVKKLSAYISANTNILSIVENISFIYIFYTLILWVKAIANGEFFIVQLYVAKFKKNPNNATNVKLNINSVLYNDSNSKNDL